MVVTLIGHGLVQRDAAKVSIGKTTLPAELYPKWGELRNEEYDL